MGRQDARLKKGETRHKTKQNWETRLETKKMERQDARQKKWGKDTKRKKQGDETQDKKN